MQGLLIKFCLKATLSEYFIVSLRFVFAFVRLKRAVLVFFLPISERKTMLSCQQEGEHVLIGREDAGALYLD